MHVQQRILLGPLQAFGSDRRMARNREAREQFDRDDNVLVLEYLRHGELSTWLRKLADANNYKSLRERVRPPEKVLWSIFFCLWRGCLGLAFPELLSKATGLDPRTVQLPLKTEDMPAGRRSKDIKPKDPLVHFDLGNLSNSTHDDKEYLFAGR